MPFEFTAASILPGIAFVVEARVVEPLGGQPLRVSSVTSRAMIWPLGTGRSRTKRMSGKRCQTSRSDGPSSRRASPTTRTSPNW